MAFLQLSSSVATMRTDPVRNRAYLGRHGDCALSLRDPRLRRPRPHGHVLRCLARLEGERGRRVGRGPQRGRRSMHLLPASRRTTGRRSGRARTSRSRCTSMSWSTTSMPRRTRCCNSVPPRPSTSRGPRSASPRPSRSPVLPLRVVTDRTRGRPSSTLALNPPLRPPFGRVEWFADVDRLPNTALP